MKMNDRLEYHTDKYTRILGGGVVPGNEGVSSNVRREAEKDQSEASVENDDSKYMVCTVPVGIEKVGIRFVASEVVPLEESEWGESQGILVDEEIRRLNGKNFRKMSWAKASESVKTFRH